MRYTKTDNLVKTLIKFNVDENDIEKIIDDLENLEIGEAEWVGMDVDGFCSGSPIYSSYLCSNCGFTVNDINKIHDYLVCPKCLCKMSE